MRTVPETAKSDTKPKRPRRIHYYWEDTGQRWCGTPRSYRPVQPSGRPRVVCAECRSVEARMFGRVSL